ncbi:MAG: endonuclease III domain-containing protein [bacterium]
MKNPASQTTKELLHIYELLYNHFGPLHWWPADTPFEVMVGAILTQNTSWKNVEKAIANLKEQGKLSPEKIKRSRRQTLARLIRPSGYFNQKAERLQDFADYFVRNYRGDWRRMAKRETAELRRELLALRGIGPETADSILLYALYKTVFVVDAYTRRAFSRLGHIPPDAGYETTQKFFVDHLPADQKLYNEFHAQVVYLGKDYCRPRPKCDLCPLATLERCRVEK